MALEPITRQEQIIAGKDLEPITRMEKFLKEYGGSGGSGGAGQFIVVVYNANPAGTIFGSDKTYNDIKAAVESGVCVVIHHKSNINAVDYRVYYLYSTLRGSYQFCSMDTVEGAVNFKFFTIFEEAGEMVIRATKNMLPAAT